MKNKTMTTNIGTINLTEISLAEETLEFFIPIIQVSDNLKATIKEQTKRAKTEYQKKVLDGKGLKWCESGTDVTYQSLHIILENHSVSYELCFEVTDKENDFIDTGFNLKVDLSEHDEEIRKIIIKAIIEKFL